MNNTPSFNKILNTLKSGKQTSCVYCGYSFVASPEAIRFATIEHLLPQAKTSKRRGSNCENNTFLCCYKCNTIRRDSLPEGIVKNEIEEPSDTLPSWLVEVVNGESHRYYIKTKKMRDKLIREIKEQFIVPESLRLFEIWKAIVWKIDSEQDEEESRNPQEMADTPISDLKAPEPRKKSRKIKNKSPKASKKQTIKENTPKSIQYPPDFDPYTVDLKYLGTFGSDPYKKS